MIWIIIAACIVVILLIIIALIILIAPGEITPEAMKTANTFYGRNCAHRGLYTKNQKIPENSVAAFVNARESGYGVELDIRLTKDEQVVVFHDEDLGRVCGVDKLMSELRYDELADIRLFGTDEKIPLFSEVLEILGDTPIIVELKTAGINNKLLCEKTLNILQSDEKNKYNRCIESFDPRIVAWFKNNAPDILRGQLGVTRQKGENLSIITTLLVCYLMSNIVSRPHFVAYINEPHPFLVKLCMMMKPMSVVWTVRPEDDIAKFERENDAVIFEYYTPDVNYK